MNTRRATDDSEFRQERYMSSPEVERGLLATCVASRANALDDPEHRNLVWWVQRLSWKPGGLDQLADEILQRWPERFITLSMEKLGAGKGRIYSMPDVRVVRTEIKDGPAFPLRGEEEDWGIFCAADEMDLREDASYRRRRAKALNEARRHPKNYPAAEFAAACRAAASANLGKFLFEEMCLNPSVQLDEHALWYLPRLVETLTELHDLRATAATGRIPITVIGREVHEALDYCLATRGLVVIDGESRIGKTWSVQQWCDGRPGRVIYFQVPESSDDISFFRSLAKALGMGSGRSYKANDLRAKIEGVLQSGDHMVVMDEGHYLFSQRNARNAIPHRINWVLNQLVNKGVRVATVTSPLFAKSQQTIERHGVWSSAQLIGRIELYKQLPDSLSDEDLQTVARHYLPEGDAKSIRTLVAYARSSQKYLQGMAVVARRAYFIAAKGKCSNPTFADVAQALREGVVPSDSALQFAVSRASQESGKKQRGTARATRVQHAFPAPAEPVQAIEDTRPRTAPGDSLSALASHARDTGASVLAT